MRKTTKYDIKYAFREYEIQGMKKTYWSNHGTMFVDEETGKMSIKIDSLPVVKDYEGWFQVFKQETEEEKTKRFANPKSSSKEFDDIDF